MLSPNPVLGPSMESPEHIVLVPSKHDGILLETLVHLPKAITEPGTTNSVSVAVIAHPWSLLGGSMYDHVVQSLFDLFAEADFLVGAYNSRGAGNSGGHGNASAQTEAEDYETVLTRVMSYAEDKKFSISNLDIVLPLPTGLIVAHGSFIASLVPPPVPQTSYILISPLLAPISKFTTFFTGSSDHSILSKHSAQAHSTSMKRILAIYGSGDIFAITTGRFRRYFDKVKKDWGQQIRVVEVESGGHFWLDARSKTTVLEEVKAFIQS